MALNPNPNEADFHLNVNSRGVTTFYDYAAFSNVMISTFSSNTNTRTSANTPESIQYLYSISGNTVVNRGNTSTIDYGSLALATTITYQIVEG